MISKRFRVGVISSVHGVHGECKVYPTTDDLTRFKKLKTVYAVKEPELERELKVVSVKFFKNMAILKFEGIDTPEEIQKIRNWDLMVDRSEAIPLKKGEYYIADLIGLRVIDEDDQELGEARDIFATGANQVLEISRPDGSIAMVPYIRDIFIKEVDLEKGYIRIHVIDGLL